MRRRTFVLTAAACVVLLLVMAAGVLGVLVRSEAGSRWVLERAQALMGDSLSLASVEGSLSNHLVLRGVRYTQQGFTAELDSVRLEWHPAALLGGELQVAELSISGAQLQLLEDTRDPESSEPFDPLSLQPPVDIALASLQLRDLVIIPPGGSAIPVSSIEAVLNVTGNALNLKSLDIESPQGSLSASAQAELVEALPLQARMEWTARLPDQRDLGGALTLAGDSDRLAIDHQGQGAIPVMINGAATDLLENPGWDLKIQWPDVLLIDSPEQSVNGSGTLVSRGTLEAFSVIGNGAALVPDVPPISWNVDAMGSSTRVDLKRLEITTEPYDLALAGGISFVDDLAAELHYEASAGQLHALSEALPPQLDAEGVLAVVYRADELSVDSFTVGLAQSPVTLQGMGTVQLEDIANPMLALQLDWSSLGWPLDTGEDIASPRGDLTINGRPQSWQANISAEVSGNQVPAGTWHGDLSGDTDTALIEELIGKTLDGELRIQGEVSWSPQLLWAVDVTGTDLNPGAWEPQLPGQLSLGMATEGSVGESGELAASLELIRLEGTLAERPIMVSARAALAGERINLEEFVLASGSNRVSGEGVVTGEDLSLQWRLQAASLAELLPESYGSLSASGSVRGNTERPRLELTASGRNLALAGVELAALNAELLAGLDSDDPLSVTLDFAGPVNDANALFEMLRLEAAGTTGSHSLDLLFSGQGVAADTRLVGGLDEHLAWTGTLASLGIDPGEPIGRWRLLSPVSITASTEVADMEELCLNPAAGGAGTLCASAGWRAVEGTRLSGRADDLQLTSVLPDVTGELAGIFELALATDGSATGSADLGLTSGVLQFDTGQGVQRFDHGGGHMTARLGSNGLEGDLVLQPLSQGEVSARVLLPAFRQLPPEGPQPLQGQLSVNLPDLSGLQAWLPDFDNVRGRITGDLAFTGELDRPRVVGDLGLINGAAEVPAAGLSLREISLGISDDPQQLEVLRIAGGLTSGEGQLTVTGHVDLDSGTSSLAINGNKLDVFNTPDAVARVSPDLTADFGDARLKVRGRIAVDRAEITPRLSLRTGSANTEAMVPGSSTDFIPPSPDVVVVGTDSPMIADEPSLPFELDSEVIFDLGQKVRVNALGFVGRITGLVIFTNPPGRQDLVPVARGAFEVQEGTFRSFGQDLEIQTGQLLFRAVPATEPEVNLRAVRWIDNDPLVTLAGVRVTGPLAAPELELYSTPQLEMTEIQSYLLTGRSPSSRDSALTIGTFVRPKLYVGYGYNLLEETSEFDALYTISPRYGAQASVGEADNNIGVTFTYER